MKFYFILNRRVLTLVFLLTLITVLLVGQFKSHSMPQKNADTHNNRINFINNLGYTVDENSATERQVLIPYEFSDVYSNYNSVQQQAGYNLLKHKGKNVICYSYNLEDEDFKVINLLVYEGLVIGGDVSSLNIDGEMLPLLKKE